MFSFCTNFAFHGYSSDSDCISLFFLSNNVHAIPLTSVAQMQAELRRLGGIIKNKGITHQIANFILKPHLIIYGKAGMTECEGLTVAVTYLSSCFQVMHEPCEFTLFIFANISRAV